ncbi:redoxin family protein [Methylopila musalis]|uniref:Redoxin family protein n=1 Tax=Methylopila musalis TaxID=1134781 RepID=A0ABW3Z4R7_9HYPH
MLGRVRAALVAVVAAASAVPAAAEPAPPLQKLDGWLNSKPLTLDALKGKVVLIDFWTYACVNCVRTLPTLVKWHEAYKDKGLVILGVHTPEFAFERDPGNVARAVARFGIGYPVAQDNAYGTWRAFRARAWPTTVLIDKDGQIALRHEGEGGYDAVETKIAELLAATSAGATPAAEANRAATPEIHLGLIRVDRLASPETPAAGPQAYTRPASLPANAFALQGRWRLEPESAALEQDGGTIALRFTAAKAHLVASSAEPVELEIEVDGVAQPPVRVGEARLYTLFDSDEGRERTLILRAPKAGFKAFSFSFG